VYVPERRLHHRELTSHEKAAATESGHRAAAKLNHMCAMTQSSGTPWPRAYMPPRMFLSHGVAPLGRIAIPAQCGRILSEGGNGRARLSMMPWETFAGRLKP
jgi:hypothetical protein